jgi:hypothetical protein
LDYGWGENHSPLTATLSRSGSGAAAPTGLLPLLGCCPLYCPPPPGGPSHLCRWSSGNITYHSPYLDTSNCVSVLSSVHLHSASNANHFKLSSAHCSCIAAIPLTAHASASAQAFTCFSCTYTASRSLLPGALIDILHNSQGLLSTHVR